MSVVKINLNNTIPFQNNACYCVGTGRMNLALRHEYHVQLEKVQREIGFQYIRGHGLFCDDMAMYYAYIDGCEWPRSGEFDKTDPAVKEEYNFTYVDMVFDDYLSLGIKPFVELGFMPSMMASGDQTIFYWKGNVTPPVDYDRWSRLISAAVMHWIDRYGRDEVISWPFEVWNEPNLGGFWKNADMDEYFRLYDVSVKAVKACDERIRVGGPAICGVDDERWMRLFLEHCRDNKVPLDFVTRHAYGTEMPEFDGHYVYQELRSAEDFLTEPGQSRKIIDSFPEYKGMELHVTEFNTSYNPRNPIHDTNLNAAYIAKLLSVFGDTCASYSYWTFGDVFEESGVAHTPFSGGFGLLANGSIPKPTYWTYVFYKNLYPTAVARGDNYIITKSESGNLRGIAWNLVYDNSLTDADAALPLCFSVAAESGTYFLLTKTVDENTCNPLKNWLDMGSPAYPSKAQSELLRQCAKPSIVTQRLDVNDIADIKLSLSRNAVCYFELTRIKPETDRGFRKERIAGL